MPGAEDTKMNKTIVLPQPVKENRLIKKVGSELREQRRDSGNLSKGVRKEGSPSIILSLPCCVLQVGAGYPCRLAGCANARQRWLTGGKERGKSQGISPVSSLPWFVSTKSSKHLGLHHDSISYQTGLVGPSFSWTVTTLEPRDPPVASQPGSGSSYLLVLISGLPHCALVGGSVLPSPVKPSPYPKFTIFEYREWFLYFHVGSDRHLPRELIPELVLKGRRNLLSKNPGKIVSQVYLELDAWVWRSRRDSPRSQWKPLKMSRKGIKCSGILEQSPDWLCSVQIGLKKKKKKKTMVGMKTS